jgi:hypothetical protein
MVLALREREPLSEARLNFLKKYYGNRKASYIARIFDEADLFDIEITRGSIPEEDFFFIARATRIVNEKFYLAEKFEEARILDMHHYNSLQRSWLEYEGKLLTWEFGRKPTTRELFEDFKKHRNGQRFRVFYCLKFPEKVRFKS